MKEFYQKDITCEQLDAELRLFQSSKYTFNETQGQSITKVTLMSSVVDILNGIPGTRRMFSEISKIVRVYLTVPMTSCTPERSFSAMRQIKSYTRSSMTQKQLNHLLLLQFYKSLTDEICCIKIAKVSE